MPSESAAQLSGDERARAAGRVVVQRAGDQLLAGAALALDEDGGVRRADLPEHVEDALHRRAAADDALEAVALVHLALQVAAFADEALFLRRLLDLRAEHVHVERLLQVRQRALLHRLDGGAHGAVPGEDEHLDLRPEALGLLDDLDAVVVAHHQVGEDQVQVALADALEALVAARGDAAMAADALERLGDRLGDARLIVNDEHLQVQARPGGFSGFGHAALLLLNRKAISPRRRDEHDGMIMSTS